MRGVIWRAVPAKFKTGMREMNMLGSEVCSVFWDVGTGWVGTHAWCNMESCSGKVQNRCVSFVMYLWELGSGWVDTHAWCNMESCSGKVQNRCVSFVMYLWELGSGWVDTHAWCNMESCSGKVQNRDVRDENLRV